MRAIVRKTIGEPDRLIRSAVVRNGAELACAVVRRRLQSPAQRSPVAVLDDEALACLGDVGNASQRDGNRSGALELGIEQCKLTIELPAHGRA